MFFFYTSKKIKKEAHAGFSLIELMVTISIVTLVTGVVMTKYSAFNSVVILKSQAYELALDIREAQVFGVSTGGGVAGEYRRAYGMYIDITSPNEYVLFQDTAGADPGNLRYDSGEAIGETYTIDSRFTILDICTTIASVEECSTSSALENVSISFKRPDFDARITSNMAPDIDVVKIVVATADDASVFRTVSVYASGQISVE